MFEVPVTVSESGPASGRVRLAVPPIDGQVTAQPMNGWLSARPAVVGFRAVSVALLVLTRIAVADVRLGIAPVQCLKRHREIIVVALPAFGAVPEMPPALTILLCRLKHRARRRLGGLLANCRRPSVRM